MTKTVATPSAAQLLMVKRARPVRTLVAGTEAMREARTLYLPKEEGESDAAYDCRVGRTFLFNATGKTIDDMTGKVFTKSITFEKDMPSDLVAMAENIDMAGRHINVFARDVFADCMQPGIGYILVDMPPKLTNPDGSAVTQEQEKAAGQRPYMTFIPLERLIGWKSTRANGAERLTQVRIKECVSEPDGDFDTKDVEQIRVLEPGKWTTYRRVEGKTDEWQQHLTGTVMFGNALADEIPIAPVYLSRTDFMQGKPPLAKLAELNIAHWQSSSDQRNIVHFARVPILFWAGKQETDSLTLGAGSAVYSTDPNSRLEVVEHSGAAIGAGRDDLKDLEYQMQVQGLQMVVAKPGPNTATGEIADSVKENSPLAMMATALQDALEAAFGFMSRFTGGSAIKAGSVVVNKDFGLMLGAASLQDLITMRSGGLISDETFWLECQRRGVLSDSFDPAMEADRLAKEAPELSGDPKKTFGAAA